MSPYACIYASFRRIGGFTATLKRAGGRLGCSVSKAQPCSFGFELTGGRMSAAVVRKVAMTCSFGLVCATSIGDEYILWASDGIVFNKYGDKIYLTKKS